MISNDDIRIFPLRQGAFVAQNLDSVLEK